MKDNNDLKFLFKSNKIIEVKYEYLKYKLESNQEIMK